MENKGGPIPMEGTQKRVVDSLEMGRVVGDVIDGFQPIDPKEMMRDMPPMIINYKTTQVFNAVELMPAAIVSQPKVDINLGDFKCFYTLLMTDPDSPGPSDPHLREQLHWVVTDIPGGTNAAMGRVVVDYETPNPRIGIHRYVFVLFKQTRRLQVLMPPSSRTGFSTRRFASEHDLGDPIAAIFFNAQRATACRKR